MNQEVMELVNEILRPRVKADGGDMVCKQVTEDTIYIEAYGDCATCKSCGEDLNWWIMKQVAKKYQKDYKIVMRRVKPYFD